MATTESASAEAVATPSTGAGRRTNVLPYLFFLPLLIFFALFLGWPLFLGLYTSMTNWNFLSPGGRQFIGLRNYQNLVNSNSLEFAPFWEAMINTFEFVVISTIPMVVIALLLAVLLNGRYRGRNIFRGIFFAPWSLSAVVASLLGWWVFQDVGGLMNDFLRKLPGLDPVSWLGTMPWAWVAIVVTTLWWTVGFNTIIYLAALQDIPEPLYEAASIDGANKVQQFFHITVPMVAPVTVFVLTIQLIASFQLFAQPQIMTRGGPADATKPIIMYIYEEGFARSRIGSAAAMSIVLAAILLIITVLNFRFFGRAGER